MISLRLRSPWVLVPMLLFLVISLGCLWFFHNFERKEITTHQGISPAARNNPLLAAEKFLLAAGYQAFSRRGMELFTELPSSEDAILIRYLPGGLSKSIQDNLVEWVTAGGHLLLVPNPTTTNHPGSSNLLDQFGVRLKEKEEEDSDCGCPPKDEQTEDPSDITEQSENIGDTEQDITDETKGEADNVKEAIVDTEDGYHPSKAIINLNVDGFPIRIESFSPLLLEDIEQSAVYRIDGSYHIEYQEKEDQERKDNFKEITEEGAWLLQYELGAGKITVFSEMTFIYNSHIGDNDHAFFLSWLIENTGNVWLLYATNVDSLFTILWDSFPLLWTSLFVLILLLLWRLQKRSGEPLRPRSEKHHNIMTHIDAAGHYNWRTDKLSAVIKSNRNILLQWLAGRKLGHRQELQGLEIDIAPLATKIGLSEAEIKQAFLRKIDSEQDLIKTSRAFQKIQALIQGGEPTRNDSKKLN